MIILDANYILRFLLNDIEEMYEISKQIIKNNKCLILNEVIAEVVFVLLEALKIFENKRSLDFVDCILCAKSEFYKIKTFDKKLNKCIEAKK